jgi:hypothetical protein
MGLDIYGRIIKKSLLDKYSYKSTDDVESIRKILNEDGKEIFINTMIDEIVKLTTSDNYTKDFLEFIVELNKFKYFKNYNYKIEDYLKNPNLKDVIERLKSDINYYYVGEDVYFRKVNFIYGFFSEEINPDTESCIVSKSRIEDLVDACKRVFQNKGDVGYAEEHLPTHAGFFFGSTQYDDWYWEDVEDCYKEMVDVLDQMDEGDVFLWEFSW